VPFYRDLGIEISENQVGPPIVGFFHPYANAGGGGERVLWTAIETIQEEWPRHICVVYTGDQDSTESILEKVGKRFNIHIDSKRLYFARLKKRHLVEDTAYPKFTLLRQSLASVSLLIEALTVVTPDIFIDTMGYSFTYWPCQQMMRCPILAYVHYPTISSDMLQRVASREYRPVDPGTKVNTTPPGQIWTLAKLIYYRLFALIYRQTGKVPDFVLCNSTWTGNHIKKLWSRPYSVVYPPCDVEAFAKLPMKKRQREILSISQFRPEKDQHSQLVALQILLSRRPEFRASGSRPVKLIIMGSVRDEGDRERAERLKAQAHDMGIQDEVEVIVNAPFADLVAHLGRASVGLSTMWNEHFGIGLVEMMAAGLVVISHDSGGPASDIMIDYQGQQIGYLAKGPAGYAEYMETVFSGQADAFDGMRQSARNAALERFTVAHFKSSWSIAIRALVQLDIRARRQYREMPYPFSNASGMTSN